MSQASVNPNPQAPELEEFSYDDSIVKHFLIASIAFGAVALLVGVLIASQLADARMNLGLPWTTFGRLRPLHTNAAIFAFAANGVFAGVYYSMQRLLKTRMYSDRLSKLHFWGWQLIIVLAAVTLPLGLTVGKEYAELEWPIAHLITVVWVIFGVNFFMTIARRRERHIYVAIWFYIATIVTTAILHVINTINLPVSMWKSYPIYAGVQDALVQWWYGHNAVAFVLTTPFLGLMYYFLPKAVDRPVYSYRLSIIHFWSLVLIYIWAGPHHLLYTALPEWAQTLGMVFSVMLIAPSWGGMVNGLLTLRGAWDRVRREPILKFFLAALTFYGMATFEGPLLSVKAVSALGHYTDWIVGHVHGGALGWNGFMLAGMTYWLVPKLWKTELHSQRMANAHFWLGFLGTLTYMISMWVAGITQGLMWQQIDPTTGRLVYPDFIETVTRIVPLYWVRVLGGLLYLSGFVIMIVNVVRTVKAAPKAVAVEKVRARRLSVIPVEGELGATAHRMMEGLPAVFTGLTAVAVLVGTAIELVPTFMAGQYVPTTSDIKPYTALELQGRDLYVREGCYTCHSQMIRPLLHETLRYGDYSRPEESRYDHPFQWGSKRTGPDLARVGGKYPDMWHYRHMAEPATVSQGSMMPAYPWLFKDDTDFAILGRKLDVMRTLGVPYTDEQVANAEADARAQAQRIAAPLVAEGAKAGIEKKEIIPLIAYLQRLGQDRAQANRKSAGLSP